MSVRWSAKITLLLMAGLLLVLGAACSRNSSAGAVPPPAPASRPFQSAGQTQGSTSGGVSIPSGKPAGSFKSALINVQVFGDTVAVPLEQVVKNINTRFKLPVPEGQETFMVYIWDGKVYVRASICPPCRSQSFTLSRGTLVCDACGTVFDATTGRGISGACVAYPKQSAQYQVDGNSVVITKADLVTAYKSTLRGSR